MVTFTPMSEKEITELRLWPKGEYDFEVQECRESISKNSGNEMFAFKVKIFNQDGKFKILDDYITFTPGMAFKLRHCSDACGLIEKYEAGQLEDVDFEGKTGSLMLGIQVDKTGTHPDKNVISDYVKREPAAIKSPVKEMIDDEIPF